MKKTLTNGSDINTLVSTRRAWEVNWYPFRGKLWLHRLYQSRVGRRGWKEMGVMSSSVYSPRDHVEESLPLPRGKNLYSSYTTIPSWWQVDDGACAAMLVDVEFQSLDFCFNDDLRLIRLCCDVRKACLLLMKNVRWRSWTVLSVCPSGLFSWFRRNVTKLLRLNFSVVRLDTFSYSHGVL